MKNEIFHFVWEVKGEFVTSYFHYLLLFWSLPHLKNQCSGYKEDIEDILTYSIH